MRVLTDNLGWKLISLLAAFLLWYAFTGESEIAASIPVLVQYRNAPPDLEIIADPPEAMFMKLRGPSSRLGASRFAGLTLSLDLRNAHAPGEQTLTITERELSLPAGVSLVRAVPSQMRVTLDRRTERTLPVEVRYAGPPPQGYRIADQRVSPSSVRVIGPESRVSRLENSTTDPLDLSSKVGVHEFRVPVYLNDPHVRFDTESPMVTVHVTLEKIPGS